MRRRESRKSKRREKGVGRELGKKKRQSGVVSFLQEGGRKIETRKLLPVSRDSRSFFSLDTLLAFFLVIKYDAYNTE